MGWKVLRDEFGRHYHRPRADFSSPKTNRHDSCPPGHSRRGFLEKDAPTSMELYATNLKGVDISYDRMTEYRTRSRSGVEPEDHGVCGTSTYAGK